MKIAGLDIGTTGCKCTVFDEQGKYLGRAYRDYPVKRRMGSHEADASAIMDGVYCVLAEMARAYPDIAGIGVTSFGETFVMTDEQGMPLYPAILYTDSKGSAECGELEELLGAKTIADITGLRPHETYSLPKMMWLKKHHPEVVDAAKYAFLMEDYVVFHLTGKRQIDYSLASRTMAFDIRKMCWSEKIFETAGIPVAWMSEPVPTGTDAGVIREAAAEKTGLSKETHIVSISHDQVAAAVGAGIFNGNIALDGAGTSQCLGPVFDSFPNAEVMYEGNYAIVPYAIPGKYMSYAYSFTGGALIQWCVDTLAKKEKDMAGQMGISVNSYLEKRSESPTGLLVLPHFAGAATPYMDSGSKGAVLGMTVETTAADIYRACMEGVVYEMYLNAKALDGSGSHFERLHATGGGAHSREWMQMKADVLNMPMTALKTVDAGTVGSAMLTGIAIGVFKDLEDAAGYMVEKTETFYPNREMHEKYMKIFERYEKVYKAVRPLM
ncbi:MAG: FGGY-family carbohydrate kinase [Eubacteriales bacterium]|nr:FGGY-family carbohydrate kinase [Eubacteriales bacterium]